MLEIKKTIALSAIIICFVISLTACNAQIIDTTYKFDYAYVSLGDDLWIEGEVQSWADWDDTDMVQVKIDGITYYTHSSNVVLVSY